MVPRRRRCFAPRAATLAATLVLAFAGCAANQISLRSVPKSPLVEELNLTSYGGPRTTPRTAQLLRVYNLSEDLGGDYRPLIAKLQAINDCEPSADKVYALAELAFLGAKKIERFDKAVALDLYGAAVLHAYDYLFDQRLAATRNPYDPEYRGACDLYNGALESVLRTVLRRWKPGSRRHQDDQHGVRRVGHHLRAARHPLAAGGFRTLRVRFRLRSQGAQEPLSDARAGRAADRRPRQLQGRASGGEVTIRPA